MDPKASVLDRDLGVLVDSNLTFHSHIDKIVARGFIRYTTAPHNSAS